MVKNKKAKKRSLAESNDEPDFLGQALKKTRQYNKSSAVPSLYKEDLGFGHGRLKSQGASFDIRLTADEKRRCKERQMRFTNGSMTNDDLPAGLSSALAASRLPKNNSTSTITKANGTFVVGTCQDLEKTYLRLTTYPKPESVRPLDVLIKSLQLIKSRYIRDEDFSWANEQLKSVRQDCTVQGLKNNFVLDVYETHARILLENGDLNEYNQCQTMIRTLTTGFAGSDLSDKDAFTPARQSDLTTTPLLKQLDTVANEFAGYRLLYALVQNSWTDLTRELAQSAYLMERDDGEERSSSCRHATLVVKAVTHNDYHGFFRLYECAPNLSAYLMDFLVKRVRASAYERIIASYRPTISVEHIREALFFKDMDETREFLQSNEAVFVKADTGEPPFWVDCKATCSK